MKATIELDDALYRQLKASAALRGRKVKDLVAEGVRRILEDSAMHATALGTAEAPALPAWFGSLREYSGNADGKHDLEALRQSVAHGRHPIE